MKFHCSTVMLSSDYIIIYYCGKELIAILSTFLNAQMFQIIWTPSPPLFNGTQNTYASKHATLKDVVVDKPHLTLKLK